MREGRVVAVMISCRAVYLFGTDCHCVTVHGGGKDYVTLYMIGTILVINERRCEAAAAAAAAAECGLYHVVASGSYTGGCRPDLRVVCMTGCMTVLMCMLPRVEDRCNANIGSVVMRDGICLLQGGFCCRVGVWL
ncbi:hypothetical protein HDV57DRAFT_121638 [Trichoderma longibrachiatum]